MDMEKLTASIKLHEGLRLKPYVDTTGHMTIGYGRNLDGQGITTDEAELLLSNDIRRVYEQAQGEAWWPHVEHLDSTSRALVEICFNMGINGFRSFKDANACLLRDDLPGAGAAILDSLWRHQVGHRAEVLASMVATNKEYAEQSIS